jgi:hypothetical protein
MDESSWPPKEVVGACVAMLPASQEWFVPGHPVRNPSAFESVMLWIAGTLTVILFVVGAISALLGRGFHV